MCTGPISAEGRKKETQYELLKNAEPEKQLLDKRLKKKKIGIMPFSSLAGQSKKVKISSPKRY